MDKSFSACELVELAIQIEKNGKDFYSKLGGLADNSESRKVFEYLANAEDKHITIFEKIFKKACDYSSEGAYPEEYFTFMKSLASDYIFTQANKGEEVAQRVKTFKEAVELGIEFEKESILFYEEMKKLVPEESRGVVDKVIEEEREHFEKLCKMKGGC